MVSVPVLSTHRKVAVPRASTAGIVRDSTPCLESLQAPSARNMVSTTGNSSGRVAIASVIPASSPSFQASIVPPLERAEAIAVTAQRERPRTASLATSLPVSRWMGVWGESVSFISVPILPSSVSAPVPVTSAMPYPEATSVPENTAAPSIRASVRSEAVFRTGTDSPVMQDSSTKRFMESISLPSAATLSPSETISRSPGTTSLPGMRTLSPSRTTSARGLDIRRRAERALSVLRSCTIVMVITMRTKPRSMSASAGSRAAKR